MTELRRRGNIIPTTTDQPKKSSLQDNYNHHPPPPQQQQEKKEEEEELIKSSITTTTSTTTSSTTKENNEKHYKRPFVKYSTVDKISLLIVALALLLFAFSQFSNTTPPRTTQLTPTSPPKNTITTATSSSSPPTNKPSTLLRSQTKKCVIGCSSSSTLRPSRNDDDPLPILFPTKRDAMTSSSRRRWDDVSPMRTAVVPPPRRRRQRRRIVGNNNDTISKRDTPPDYGGLFIEPLPYNSYNNDDDNDNAMNGNNNNNNTNDEHIWKRRINPHNIDQENIDYTNKNQDIDSVYEDGNKLPFIEFAWSYMNDDDVLYKPSCRKSAVTKYNRPNCLLFHEIGGIGRDDEEEYGYLLGMGYYRSSWGVQTKSDQMFVLKILQVHQDDHALNFEMVRNEAIVSDLFSASDKFVDIYGYCGGSTILEAMLGPSIEDLVFPPDVPRDDGRIMSYLADDSDSDSDDYEEEEGKEEKEEDDDDEEYFEYYTRHSSENNQENVKYVRKQTKYRAKEDNNTTMPHGHFEEEEKEGTFQPLTPTEKLIMALNMSEAIAHLHGFKDGIIYHSDIQIIQFLIDENGMVKLSDFNKVDIMLYNEESGEYCKYWHGGGAGSVRAPEEYAGRHFNEKVDVYSFGMILYSILYHCWPYYDYDDDYETPKSGIPPTIDESLEEKSYPESVILKVMKLCFERNPNKRIDIFSVVSMLRDAVENNKNRE